jgi:thiol:disulfide interchange protein DsbD
MGFVQQANDTESKPWQHGLIFTLGVLVSFWILAGALLVLQAGGEQLGWGFQLQSPVFLIILSAFMFLFGLSMFGVFEIGTSLTAVGGTSQSSGGWMGSFVSGVTATVVATPCTAPFMGSALGFALSQPAWVAMTIFTFLGLGMASPYVLLSSIPSLLKFVPKPGRWMESLKQFMGFLLMATVLWLMWVLSIQAGSMMVIIVLGVMLILGVAGWIYGRWGNLAMPIRTRAVSTIIALILIIGSLYISLDSVNTYAVTPGNENRNYAGEGIQWQTFSAEYLDQLKSEGKPVFLDFTAAWCLSCQVNERVAFSSEEVQQRFQDLGIIPLKADWTSRDESITQALARYGRNSVPLYVYYSGEDNQEPVILPEIITPGIVLEALK